MLNLTLTDPHDNQAHRKRNFFQRWDWNLQNLNQQLAHYCSVGIEVYTILKLYSS